MTNWPDYVLRRAFVLNCLREGPARLGDIYREGAQRFGYHHTELDDAIRWFRFPKHKLDGETYITRQANLAAIWWGKRPHAHRWTATAGGGCGAA